MTLQCEEWHTVYILQPFSLPLDFVLEAGTWESAQEQNVAYVAITRAKSELLFLKHIRNLMDKAEQIVQLFGEEAASPEDEQWWDAHGSRQDDPSGPGPTPYAQLSRLSAAQLLGVRPGAAAGEVNAAFKKLALSWHPDKAAPDRRAHAAEVFPRMLAARELLMAGG